MALQIITDCCNVTFKSISVCDCFAGFEASGLTPSTEYAVSIKTAKTVYTRSFTSDITGLLQIPVTSYPDRVFNRFGGSYELQISGVTFGAEEYTGYKFAVIDCSDTGFYTLPDTPNE